MIESRQITRADHSLTEREALAAQGAVGPADRRTPHILLATCNRTEAYWGEGEIPPETARHLFRVAAGLESSLIGERAIQGQLREAYLTASEAYGRLPAELNRLFQTAIHVGKRVRNETRIACGAVTHSQLTVDMLRAEGIDLDHKVVAIIGVNKLTEDILKYLHARGALRVYLSNRHYDKALALSARYGGTAFPLSRKADLLREARVVISATSAPHAILRESDLPPGRTEPLLLFDLAFPRDIDPAIGRHEGVTLYDLDDMERFARRNLTLRRGEIGKAEAIIEDELAELARWQCMRAKFREGGR